MNKITITIASQRDLIIHVSRGTEHRHRNQVHRDRTKYRRQEKHKGKDR